MRVGVWRTRRTMRIYRRRLPARFGAGALRGLPDAHLLDLIEARHHEAAFAEPVRRPGPVVMGVRRGSPPKHHDAKDASPANFRVLARRAGTTRPPERLAAWTERANRRSEDAPRP